MRNLRRFQLKWVLAALSLVALAWEARAAETNVPGYTAVPLKLGGHNRLAVATTVVGKPVLFLLDTGASLSSIDRESVQQGKLQPPTKQSGIARQKVMNGRKTDVVWLPSLRAGTMDFGALPMTVLGEQDLFRDYCDGELHGLLGSDLLRRYEAVVSTPARQVYFKTDPTVSVDLGKVLQPGGYRGVKLVERGGLYYVPCLLKGRFPFLMLVDTGAPTTTLQKKKLELFGIRSQPTKMRQRGINGYAVPVDLVRPTDHKLIVDGWPMDFPLTAADDPLLNRQSQDDELGILGCDMLGLHGAVLDYATLTLYLRAAGKK